MALSAYESYDALVVPVLGEPFVDFVTEPLADAPPGPILDVACGTGVTARGVGRRYPDRLLIGSDIDGRAVRYARSVVSGAGVWLALAVDHVPFRDGAVAGVVCQQGAQFFLDPSRACEELARVTANAGVIVVLAWTADGAEFFRILDEALVSTGAASSPFFERPTSFDVDRWRNAATRAGLSSEVDVVRAPFVVDDVRAFVEHFIEPSDGEPARAQATEGVRTWIAKGAGLSATRVVHRRA